MKAQLIVREALTIQSIIRLALGYAIATNGLVLIPFLVAAVMSRFGLDESVATQIAGLEIIGIAISCAVFPRLIAKAAPLFVVIGVLGTGFAQALSYFAPTIEVMGAARSMAGLFEGMIFVVIASALSQRVCAERVWGQINLIAGGLNGSILIFVSLLPDAWINRGIFFTVFCLVIVTSKYVLPIGCFAERGDRLRSTLPTGKPSRALIFAIWAVTILIYGVQASQWAVAGLVSERAGLTTSTIGIFLSLSSLIGFLGAIFPAMSRSQGHRLVLIILAQLVMIVSLIGFFESNTLLYLFLNQVALNCSFFVVIPFLTGLLSEIDSDGTLVARTVVLTFVGAGIGTAIAGQLYHSFGGRQFAILLGIGIVLAIPFVWAAFRERRKQPLSYSS